MATRLVAAGSDIFAVDSENRSPASYAIEQGRSAIQALVAVPDGIKMRDGFGNGLLHYAANAGNTESAKTVLSLGADPSLRNIRGETAMALALKRDNKALADILDFRTK